MFDRRVKIFLSLLILITLVLLARMMQIQVLGQSYWNDQAQELMTTGELIETVRGRLLDRNRNPIAVDAPCIDAAVDFRAILFTPDPKFVSQIAVQRVRARVGTAYGNTPRAQRVAMIDQEKRVVLDDIRIMWEKLADVGGLGYDQMDDLRRSIIRKVDIRRRKVWYTKFENAMEDKAATSQPASWYHRWLMDESQDIPEIDEYFEPISEEREAHVVLSNLTNATNIYLGKNRDRFPGLDLRPSLHRTYPYGDVAAHIIGSLRKVSRKDLDLNENNRDDELRHYELNDLIGRSGLESLCEQILRGTRGKIERNFIDVPRERRISEPVPGRDVLVTLDMELQRDIQNLFHSVELVHSDDDIERLEMYGAAVVMDVKSSQVLAMVSYPTYNLNVFDEIYPMLVRDEINRPLMNRATMYTLEPGSTVKTIVGMGAITDGIFGPHDTVECTGYLVIGGRKYMTLGRCWVASYFEQRFGVEGVSHHPFPHPHPTGFLTFPDALERSCNVFFETLGDRMGVEGLGRWYKNFGLGKHTGIGIAEFPGMVPDPLKIPAARRRNAAWFSGIGQDQVLATPLQMANVAATIARNGVWMRPRLLVDQSINPQTLADRGLDRDLKLSPDALSLVREGMVNAVNARSGTGQQMHFDHITVAGKTGSAQAAPLSYAKRDPDGKFVEWIKPEFGTRAKPNPQIPWYRGTGPQEDRRSHAWVIGFAPAQDPKIAFAVLVEYGGGGGATAGAFAKRMLDACIQHGYLPKK